jgi:hypothetical protein
VNIYGAATAGRKRGRQPPAAEFLDVPRQIEARVPEGLEVDIVMDNEATHKTLEIKA